MLKNIPTIRPKRSMGRLPNDVRTHLIASGTKDNALLAKLLLLQADYEGIRPTIRRGQ